MASVTFNKIAHHTYRVNTIRAGARWPEGDLLRASPRQWVWVMESNDTLGCWPSEERAKVAISDFVESWSSATGEPND